MKKKSNSIYNIINLHYIISIRKYTSFKALD